jgi:hypothetical protein
MSLISLEWINWRVIQGENGISMLLYALLFTAVLLLAIQLAE